MAGISHTSMLDVARVCSVTLLFLIACAGPAEPSAPVGEPTPVPAPVGGATPLPLASPPSDTGLATAETSDGMQEFLRQTSPEELAKRAELIILGTTIGPQVSGRLPPDSPLAPSSPPGEPMNGTQVYTETPIQVERVLKGTAPSATVLIRTLGGTVDGLSYAVTHQPQLHVGQRVVVFLTQIEPGYYTVLGEDGVYEIVDEEARGVRHRYPLADLLNRITGNGSS